MANNDRNINTTLKFILDKNSLRQVEQGTLSVEDALEKVQRKLIDSRKTLVDISEGMKKWEGQAKRNFVASTAFITGVFLYSQRYIKNLEQSNSLSRRWEASSQKIEKSQERIGAVVTEAILPAFERGARVVEKVAQFVEQNPEVVKGALNIGLLVLGFNALSVIAARGIRFVADVSYIATTATQLLASKQMQDAANKQLAASVTMNGNQWAQQFRNQTGYGTAAVVGGTSITATVATILAVITGGVVIGTYIYDLIAKHTGGARVNQIATGAAYSAGQVIGSVAQRFGMSPEEAERKSIVFAAVIGRLTGAIDESSPLWLNAYNSIKKVNDILENTFVSGSKFEEQIVDAYTRMKEQEVIATEQYEKEKEKIIDTYSKNVLVAIANNANAVNTILSNYQKQIGRITESYQRESREAERRYNQQRSQIIRDGGIEIERIEEDLQDRLIKLRRDHNEKVGEAVARRDALALKKEIRGYNQKREDEINNTNKEIARRRQDLGIRLRDLDENFKAERKAKFEDYKRSLDEAKAQRDEALKVQVEKHKEELRQLQLAKQEQLRTLRESYMEENKRRRDAFIAYIGDLDASLLGEQRKKKQQYYDLMLQDVERFLQQYRTRLPGASGRLAGSVGGGRTNRVRDTGGYMERGMYAVAQNGVPEYALKGSLTKLAEGLVGGRLTQENIAGLMLRGSMTNNVYNDNSRYDNRLSKEDIRIIEAMQDRKIKRMFS